MPPKLPARTTPTTPPLRCCYHLPGNRECPYPPLYDVVYRPHRLKATDPLRRSVCVAHLAPAVDQAIGDSPLGAGVVVEVLP